jgi:hypothetical protein
VPHLGTEHGIEFGIIDGQVLGAPGPHVGTWRLLHQNRAHLGIGLDGDYVETTGDEGSRQRAGPGA